MTHSEVWLAHFVGESIKCVSISNFKNKWRKRTQRLNPCTGHRPEELPWAFVPGKHIACLEQVCRTQELGDAVEERAGQQCWWQGMVMTHQTPSLAQLHSNIPWTSHAFGDTALAFNRFQFKSVLTMQGKKNK